MNEQDKDIEILSKLESDSIRMEKDLDELPKPTEEEIAVSRQIYENIYKKLLSSDITSFKPSLVRENDPAKSYLGYPYKVLEVLKEDNIDQARAKTLIHHLPELKLCKPPLPYTAKDLSSQRYLSSFAVQEFVKGSKIRATQENRNQKKYSFVKGKRALDRLILVPEIILFQRAKNYCEDEQNKSTFDNQVFYPSDITAKGDARSDTHKGQILQSLGVQAVHKFAEWLKSEQRAIQAYIALSSNIILIALGYSIENDLFADRSNVTKLKKAFDKSSISVCSVYSSEYGSESVPSIQSGKSSLLESPVVSGNKMIGVKGKQSPQSQNLLSFNLAEVKFMIEKKLTKSRLHQLLEEVGSIKSVEAKVKEAFVEKTRQKHLKLIGQQEADLKAQLDKVQQKRKEEETKVLDDDPEVKEFIAPSKKVKKLEEQDNFNRLCKLMEDSQYEKITDRIEGNQLIAHDLENEINKLRQELERVNADTNEAARLFSSTEFYEYLNTIEKSRQCYKCLQSEGYTFLVYSEDCPHQLCDKCANIQLDQVENKNYAVSLVGYEYLCLLCGSEASIAQRKVFGIVMKRI
jgi:hypothetical protein